MATNAIEFYVKLRSGKTLTLSLLASAKIEEVQKAVATDLGVSIGRIRIKYDGKTLDPGKTLGSLGVRIETILKTEVIESKPLNVIVEPETGEKKTITISNTCTVKEINEIIAEETALDAGKLSVKFKNKALNDHRCIAADLALEDGSILKVTKKKTESHERTTKETEEVSPEEMEEKRDEVVGTFAAEGKKVEVVFSFDTTGSMYSCLSRVRSCLEETVERLIRDIPGIRIGIIAHGDYCDQNSQYVLRSVDLTSNVQELVSFVNDVPGTGGGDTPECYEWSLHCSRRLNWTADAAKALVIIGDCEPHPPSYTDQHIWWKDELAELVSRDIKVYGVRALNSTSSECFYKTLARESGGAYIQFKHFSLIQEMFLAVCYQEASPEQLDQYCAAVEDEGNMTSEVKDMLNQIKNKEEPKTKEASPVDEIQGPNAGWWDRTLDDTNQTPQYSYDRQTDIWSTVRSSVSCRPIDSTYDHSTHYISPAVKRKGSKKKCSVM